MSQNICVKMIKINKDLKQIYGNILVTFLTLNLLNDFYKVLKSELSLIEIDEQFTVYTAMWYIQLHYTN